MNLGCLWSATTTDQLPPSPESCRLSLFSSIVSATTLHTTTTTTLD